MVIHPTVFCLKEKKSESSGGTTFTLTVTSLKPGIPVLTLCSSFQLSLTHFASIHANSCLFTSTEVFALALYTAVPPLKFALHSVWTFF